jgi:hypothetical protein
MSKDDDANTAKIISIAKSFSLNKFKSKRAAAVAGVGTLLGELQIHSIAQGKDFVRLHPNQEDYWSDELCFVSVPIKGSTRDTLHLIDEDVAVEFLPSGKIQRFRLALATKPFDIFFLCQIPSRNVEDNSWNISNVKACERARTRWVQASSRREEGVDAYKVDFARYPDAFPEPKWPAQTLDEMIATAFAGRMIEDEEHPGLKRLIGARQSVT